MNHLLNNLKLFLRKVDDESGRQPFNHVRLKQNIGRDDLPHLPLIWCGVIMNVIG
jgi:hypothetical protein